MGIYITDKGERAWPYRPTAGPPCLKSKALFYFYVLSGHTRDSYLRSFKDQNFSRELVNIAIDELIEEGLLEENKLGGWIND